MRISQRKLTDIKPYQQKPTCHDGRGRCCSGIDSRSMGSISRWWLMRTSEIIIAVTPAGRPPAKLGLAKVPVHVAKGLSPAQVRAYRIADNQTATLAEWDADLLSLELADLQAMGFDLELTGFSADELAKWSGDEMKEGLTDPDEVPEAPDEPITKNGDLWLLGIHRLLCGDSTSIEDTLRVMNGEKAAIVATDPPYLVDYTGDRPNESGKDWSDTYREIDISDADAFFTQLFTCVLEVVAPKAAIYCWHAHKRCGVIQRTWDQLGILDHQQIIWVKPTPVFGRVYWHFRHEPCMLGWVRGSQPDHDGRHEVDSVWNVDWEGKARVVGNKHPTQKPVELFARPMRKHTRAGDVCFEPFSGSGSQILAAEQLGRRCFAMEIAPTFVDVAVERWEQFTGQKAERIPATEEVKA